MKTRNSISISIITAAVILATPALALASTTTPTLGKPAAGFYIGTQRLNPANIEKDVYNYGGAAIHFVAPPASAGPIKVDVKCGPFKYSYIHTPNPETHYQIWENTNGKAMSEKMINACQRARDPLIVRFSPIVKKHATPGTRFAAKAVGVPAALITPGAPAPGGFHVTARESESNPFSQGVRFIVRFF